MPELELGHHDLDENDSEEEARDLEESDARLREEVEEDPGIAEDDVLVSYMRDHVHAITDIPKRLIESISNPDRRAAVEARQAEINEKVRLANEEHERELSGEPPPEEPPEADLSDTVAEAVDTFRDQLDVLRRLPYPAYDERREALLNAVEPAERLASIVGDPNGNPASRVDAWGHADEKTREQAAQFFGVVGPFDVEVDGEEYTKDLQSFKQEALTNDRWTAEQLDLAQRRGRR
jgi:hypothetical protein